MRARAQMSVRPCLVVLLGACRGVRRGQGLTFRGAAALLPEAAPGNASLRRVHRPWPPDGCDVCVPCEPWGALGSSGGDWLWDAWGQ